MQNKQSTTLVGHSTLFVVSVLGLLGGCVSEPTRESSAVVTQVTTEFTAMTVAERMLIVDTHIDVPYRLRQKAEDVAVAAGGDFDWPRAVTGGLNAAFMSIYIPASVDAQGEATQLADELIDGVEALVANAPTKFAPAYCVADLLKAKQAGRISMPLGMENGGPVAGDFAQLAHFRDRGVRYITLAHSKWNHIADSSYDSDEHWGGLSEFGKRLVPEMNRAGVMVDVSHITDSAFWQVLKATQIPVIASHSSLRHFTPGFHRNMSDDMVVALGAQGGVIQINFGSTFLTAVARQWSDKLSDAAKAYAQANDLESDDERLTQFREQYRHALPFPYATTKHVLDHIDRVVQLAGVDHVGIGSDYDGVGDSLPHGLKDVSGYPALIAGLMQRGYSVADVAKIMGGNLLRVWQATEDFAAAAGNAARCAL
jgi:membrane dipeptidase